MTGKSMLVVEDQLPIVNSYRKVFGHEGYQIVVADSPADVEKTVRAGKPDIVLLDIDLKGDGQDRSGAEVLRQLRKQWPFRDLPVIVVSGTIEPDYMAELDKLGVDDYFFHPIDDYRKLIETVNRLVRRTHLEDESLSAKRFESKLVGKSIAIREMTRKLLRAAKAGCDVLILGERGTGKDLLAKFYHQASKRANKVFCEINCSELVSNLTESEIFGHEADSFNNAKKRLGLIETSDGGTVFINEIGNLSLNLQQKFLRVIESKKIRRVGSNEDLSVDVMIIAATNKPLREMAAKGEFMNDLYDRLNSVVIENPPLRERLKDIPLLVEHFIAKYNARLNRNIKSAAPEVLSYFQRLSWPGNVRQLEKVIQIGVLNSLDEKITVRDIEDVISVEETGAQAGKGDIDFERNYAGFKDQLDVLQKKYLLHHLQKHHFKYSEAASAIGIQRQYLYELIKRLGIEKNQSKP